VVIGLGLIGGSVGMALRAAGWHVSGVDVDPELSVRALAAGAIDEVGDDDAASLYVIATPASAVAATAMALLERRPDQELLVTDVAGVKAAICAAVQDPRFIGGHPMAGSEQVGIEGARADLFVGATWVLSPGPSTPPERYARLVGIVRSLGAQTLALPAAVHDRLVAHVSHVPHLVAASLMNQAAGVAEDDTALLQLAAGGFRDMTRIASGDPGIWPDLCVENRDAILEALDALALQIRSVRTALSHGDRGTILELLERAQQARKALPGRATHPSQLAQVRVPVPDEAGVIATVAAAASELGVSVVDVEIAHSVEGDRGVLIVVVAQESAERYAEALRGLGFACTVQEL
jgi:prephenate dehydrogenase